MVTTRVILIFVLFVSVCAVIAQDLPVFNTDGAPIVLREDKRFVHIVADVVTFSSTVDTTRVTLRTASTEGRTNIGFTTSSSYIVIATGADSVVNQSGASFVIHYPTALRGKKHSYIAIGN